MKYDLLKYTLLVLLLLGGYACVPTDTGVHNPNEKIYCDIKTQLNGNDGSVKSEVRFYVKDEESRPYFLDSDVMMDGVVMDKKFVEHKGIYYSLAHQIKEKEKLILAFKNLDDVEYEVDVPLESLEMELEGKMKMDDLRQIKLGEGESLLLIDAKGKIFDLDKNEAIALGEIQVMKTLTKDSLYQLKDKLWVKYNAKSLSMAKSTELLD